MQYTIAIGKRVQHELNSTSVDTEVTSILKDKLGNRRMLSGGSVISGKWKNLNQEVGAGLHEIDLGLLTSAYWSQRPTFPQRKALSSDVGWNKQQIPLEILNFLRQKL